MAPLPLDVIGFRQAEVYFWGNTLLSAAALSFFGAHEIEDGFFFGCLATQPHSISQETDWFHPVVSQINCTRGLQKCLTGYIHTQLKVIILHGAVGPLTGGLLIACWVCQFIIFHVLHMQWHLFLSDGWVRFIEATILPTPTILASLFSFVSAQTMAPVANTHWSFRGLNEANIHISEHVVEKRLVHEGLVIKNSSFAAYMMSEYHIPMTNCHVYQC